MKRIPSQIGSDSFKWSGISAVIRTPPQSPSSVEKEGGSVISPATAKCAARTNELSTTCLNRTAVVRFGCVIVDFSGAEAHRDGVKIPLTAHEFKVLRYFVDNPGRVISRREFLDNVWGYNAYPTTRTVDNQIYKLRHRLELHPKSPCYFVTVHGIGYKFVHKEVESRELARLESAQTSIRKDAGWEGECDGVALRNIILRYLSALYEFLAHDCRRDSMSPEGVKASIIRDGPALLSLR